MDPIDRQSEELDLRAAVLSGSERAWRTLYERHFDVLYAYVYARTRDAHRTEEIVQETWTTAVRRIGSFDPARGPFGGWMRGIADRQLVNERRRWARRSRLWEARSSEVAAEPVEVDSGEAIEAALATLPEHYRDALREKYEECRSVNEMAGMRGLSEKAVESLLSRARGAFRAAWLRLASKESQE